LAFLKASLTHKRIIALAVIADFYWLDVDKKRWGWMKNSSKQNRILFFIAYLVALGFIYLGLSIK